MILLRSIPWSIASMLVSAAAVAAITAVLLTLFRLLHRSKWGQAVTVISMPLLPGAALLAAPALALLAGFALIRFDILTAADLFGPSPGIKANLIKVTIAGISAAPLPAMLATKTAIADREQGAALNAIRRSAGLWLAGLLVAEAIISAPGLGSMLPDVAAGWPLVTLMLGIVLLGIIVLIAPDRANSRPGPDDLSRPVRPVLMALALLAGAALLALMLSGPLSGAGLNPAADTSLLNQPPESIGRLGTDRAGRDVLTVLGAAARNSLLQAGSAALLALLLGMVWRRFASPLAGLDQNSRLKTVFNPAPWLLILYPILPTPTSRVALVAILLALSLPAGRFHPASLLSLMAVAFLALLFVDVLAGGMTLGGLVGQAHELAAGVNVVRGAGYYGLALWYGIATLVAGGALGVLTGAVAGCERMSSDTRG